MPKIEAETLNQQIQDLVNEILADPQEARELQRAMRDKDAMREVLREASREVVHRPRPDESLPSPEELFPTEPLMSIDEARDYVDDFDRKHREWIVASASS